MGLEQWSDDVVVVHLADDPQCGDDLDALERAARARPSDAVVDFSAVRFLNSSNIAHLLRVRRLVVEKKRRMVLCGLSTPVWSTFLVTGIDKLFTVSDNVPTGLATLQLT